MTQKFDTALSLALEAHAGQIRKGTENALGLPLPYITHPVAVATLVQRYGSRDAMITSALAQGWADLESLTAVTEAEALVSAKGAQGLLKDIGTLVDIPALLAASRHDQALTDRAEAWRKAVETAIAVRLGGGPRGREAGALMFAAWQGRMVWDSVGGKTFRLGEALRRAADHRAM